MIKTDRVIIVEGRYDKIKLSSFVDGIIIETDGFGIFKDKDKQKLIRRLARERGIAILTDSDSAGFVIRSFLLSIIPKEQIINVYIPDIFGKEKRKDSPSKEGKLGVEGLPAEIIEESFKKAHIGFETTDYAEPRKKITATDLFEDGLTGGKDSQLNRKKLLKYLDLPEKMTTKRLLEMINIFMTFDGYKDAVRKSQEEI